MDGFFLLFGSCFVSVPCHFFEYVQRCLLDSYNIVFAYDREHNQTLLCVYNNPDDMFILGKVLGFYEGVKDE